MQIMPGSFLLTSSVGGTDTNWRNRLLGLLIIEFQKIGELDGQAGFGHAEIIVDDKGSTFAARWRTRERGPEKGLDAYIGSKVMIIEPLIHDYSKYFQTIYGLVKSQFDGSIYPIHRLIMQAISKFVFPSIVKINLSGMGICSEVVGYSGVLSGLFDYWSGMTPAIIEDEARKRPSFFRIAYEGEFPGTEKYFKM